MSLSYLHPITSSFPLSDYLRCLVHMLSSRHFRPPSVHSESKGRVVHFEPRGHVFKDRSLCLVCVPFYGSGPVSLGLCPPLFLFFFRRTPPGSVLTPCKLPLLVLLNSPFVHILFQSGGLKASQSFPFFIHFASCRPPRPLGFSYLATFLTPKLRSTKSQYPLPRNAQT